MAKKTVYTLKNHLGYDGKKINEEKALKVLEEIGYEATSDIGETPLIVASYLGRTAIVKEILLHVENVDFKVPDSHTETALLAACPQRRLESIKLLVEAGAALEQTDKSGLTPLCKVFTNAFSDPIPSARYLVSKGAKITDRVLEIGMSWNEEKFSAFLKSIDFKFEPRKAPKEVINPPKEVQKDTEINIKELHYKTNKENYLETAKVMWLKLVPKSGQATTVQGELLRALERLRDEARRNGNGNFNKNCHVQLIDYLKKYLLDDTIFDSEVILRMEKNLKAISIANQPCLDDEIYKDVRCRIIDWFLANPTQIPHEKNERLTC